jgi:hypothetical protein
LPLRDVFSEHSLEGYATMMPLAADYLWSAAIRRIALERKRSAGQ